MYLMLKITPHPGKDVAKHELTSNSEYFNTTSNSIGNFQWALHEMPESVDKWLSMNHLPPLLQLLEPQHVHHDVLQRNWTFHSWVGFDLGDCRCIWVSYTYGYSFRYILIMTHENLCKCACFSTTRTSRFKILRFLSISTLHPHLPLQPQELRPPGPWLHPWHPTTNVSPKHQLQVPTCWHNMGSSSGRIQDE